MGTGLEFVMGKFDAAAVLALEVVGSGIDPLAEDQRNMADPRTPGYR